MTSYQKKQNELFIQQIIQYSTIWVWTDKLEKYEVKNGKLKPTSKRGEKEIKKIVSDEFFKNRIISLN
jgi:hypothetical protein